MTKFVFLIMLFAFFSHSLFGQGRPYEGPEDPAGDISAEREGVLNGNRVLMNFQNNTAVGHGRI